MNGSVQLREFFKCVECKTQHITDWFTEFPPIAAESLKNFDTSFIKDADKFLHELKSLQWPPQQFQSGHFADLSFTLFRNDNIFLDLYVWYHQDTSIHNHHFSGAFKIVSGESFHISYKFKDVVELAPWLFRGSLQVNEQSTLIDGDVVQIDFSDDFIHQNMHTSNPCLTLCLRTLDHPSHYLSAFYNLGLKVETPRASLAEIKMLEYADHLVSCDKMSSAENVVAGMSDHVLYGVIARSLKGIRYPSEGLFGVVVGILKKRDEERFMLLNKIFRHQDSLSLNMADMFKNRP